MLVTTKFLRAWLRRQYQIAQAAADPSADPPVAATPLIDQLYSQLADRVDAIETGKTVLSTSANGQTVTYSSQTTAVGGSPGAGSMPEVVEDMITRYDAAKAELVAGGNASPSDAQILDQMLTDLVPVRSRIPDYTALLVR